MFFTIYWFSLFHFCTANLCKQHLPLISGGWPGQHDALSVCTVTYAYQHKGGPLSSCSGLTSNPQQFLSCELSSQLAAQIQVVAEDHAAQQATLLVLANGTLSRCTLRKYACDGELLAGNL